MLTRRAFMSTLSAAATGALIVGSAGCGRKRSRASASVPRAPRAARPNPEAAREALRAAEGQTGIASWYGYPYHGRQAADGEIYDMEKLTAAHRTLPFGTWVRVTNLANGKTVDVRITDRGPFVRGRIIDLSLSGAALALDARPPMGSPVMVGNLRATVVRLFEDGIAVEFAVMQTVESIEQGLA